MAGKFEVYEDKAGKYRFRLKAGNGAQSVVILMCDGRQGSGVINKKGEI